MIAVTFALPTESRDFRKLPEVRGGSIAVLHTGVGRRPAHARVREFLARERPRLVISAGFAGALTEELRVADLLLAQNFSDGGALAAAREALSGCAPVVGSLTSADEITDSRQVRAELARITGAVAVDMETQVIAGACAERQVPMLSLRAITDTPQAPFGIPAAVLFDLERQRTPVARLVGYLAQHPRAVGNLLRILRQVKSARSSLSAALKLVVENL